MEKFLIISSLFFYNVGTILASVIHIPADYNTFAEAFTHASYTDTILVAPGTYEEHIKSWTSSLVISEQGPLVTKIQGTIMGTSYPFHLDGFTISGYNKDLWGVIDLVDTVGYIRNCIITIEPGQAPENEPWRCLSLYDYMTRMEISHCIFNNSHNSHQDLKGGGAFFYWLDSLNLHHCLFINCTANEFGGGLYSCEVGDLTIANNVFINNTAPSGSAIYDEYSWQAKIYNNIFINNHATEENGSAVCGPELFEGSPFLSYNCFWNNTGGDFNVSFNESDIGNIFVDPLFIDPANMDFHLNECSYCIDSGHPDSDFSEEPEPNGCRINMGMYGNTSEAAVWGDGCPTRIPSPTNTPQPTGTPRPTATPGISPTPFPSPSATPFACTATGVTLEMPQKTHTGGDIFFCNAHVCNQSDIPLVQYPLFILLEIQGEYFFAPSFSQAMDSYLAAYPEFATGETMVTVLEPFKWPDNAGSFTGARFIGALTDPGINQIIGGYDSVTFGWD